MMLLVSIVSIMSRYAMPSLSASIVNWMVLCRPLAVVSSVSAVTVSVSSRIHYISSIYLLQRVISGTRAMICSSILCMKMFA